MATAEELRIEEDQESKKIRLEAILARELAPLFTSYLQQYQRAIENRHGNPQQLEIKARLEEILNQHYLRVQEAFRGDAFIGFDPVEANDFAKTSYELALARWGFQQAPLKAQIITDTNTVQAERNLSRAHFLLSEENEEFTRIELALLATALLRKDFRLRRRRLIPNTETQAAAESTKFLKAKEATRGVLAGSFMVQKTWNSILDGRERPTHNAANGQSVPNMAPFQVGSSSLMYPGDPAGALKEVINCRCFVTSKTIRL